MAKIAICSDIHFHSYSSYITTETVFNVFDQILTYCDSNGIEDLYILGDLFHVRGKIPVVVFNRVHALFKCATDQGIKLHLISGNHDQCFNEDLQTSSICSLAEIDGVDILNFESWELGKCKFVGIPYVNTNKEFMSYLDKYKESMSSDKINILFTHGMVKGAVVSSGYSFSHSTGVEEGLRFFDLAFVGHIHETQRLFDGKVIITGAPLCHSKKDMNGVQRGFWVLDTNTIDLAFVPTKYPKFISNVLHSREELLKFLKDLTPFNVQDFIFLTVTEQIEDLEAILKPYNKYYIEVDVTAPIKRKEARLETSLADSEEAIVEKYIQKFGSDYNSDLLKHISTELFDDYSKMIKEKVA
jgi:DNA repair exonuclease SbcCD nuclease subunit